MSHPFDDEAVKAGMQTLFELPGFFDPPKAARKMVDDILSAAFKSAMDRGMTTTSRNHIDGGTYTSVRHKEAKYD